MPDQLWKLATRLIRSCNASSNSSAKASRELVGDVVDDSIEQLLTSRHLAVQRRRLHAQLSPSRLIVSRCWPRSSMKRRIRSRPRWHRPEGVVTAAELSVARLRPLAAPPPSSVTTQSCHAEPWPICPHQTGGPPHSPVEPPYWSRGANDVLDDRSRGN